MKLIEMGGLPQGEEVVISEMAITYMQESDETSGDCQELKIGTDDMGAGTYYYLSTERWAFNTIEEIVDILNDFITRTRND